MAGTITEPGDLLQFPLGRASEAATDNCGDDTSDV